MRILITGCNGQLGSDMMLLCKGAGHDVRGIDFPEIDITNKQMTIEKIKPVRPDIIINCSAYTNVDDCEYNQSTAFSINASGTENIGYAAVQNNASVIHFSTDYVFDGKKKTPYIESDTPNPLSVYGKSKLEGEKRLQTVTNRFFIFRIAWLYGKHGNNFVKNIISAAKKRAANNEPLKVVNDQHGTPTWTKDVCRQVLQILETDLYGIYHCTCEGECTWYEFTCSIMKHFKMPVTVIPCTTEEFPRPAPRPEYAVLENKNLKSINMNRMETWERAFDSFLSEVNINDL